MSCKTDSVDIHPVVTARIVFDVDQHVNSTGEYANRCRLESQNISTFGEHKIVTIKVFSDDAHIVNVLFVPSMASYCTDRVRCSVYLGNNKHPSIDNIVTSTGYFPTGDSLLQTIVAPLYVPTVDSVIDRNFRHIHLTCIADILQPPSRHQEDLPRTCTTTYFNIIFIDTEQWRNYKL